MAKKSKTPQHLLIIRRSAMGDVAMVAHAVRALRKSYPDIRISMLTKPMFEPLFKGLNVEILPPEIQCRYDGVRGIMHLAGVIADLGVDCVADLHSVLRTSLLRTFLNFYRIPSSKLLKGRVIKWMRMDGGCSEPTAELKHTVIRYCDVLRKVGFVFDDPDVPEKIERPIPFDIEKRSGERWIGIAPFSVHEGKCYPLPLVREVIAQLSARYSRVFVHSGGGDELSFAEEIAQRYENVSTVFSKISLAQEIDLISNLDCLISMDSFAMHVASLTATPCVSVWGATHPSLGFSGYGAGNEGFVQEDLPCRPCSTFGNKPCRFKDYRCLNKIEPSRIVERVVALLSK